MKFLFLLFIVVLSSSSGRSSLCVPGTIDDITLDGVNHIKWTSNPGECTISYFIVEITDGEQDMQKIYNVSDTDLYIDTDLEYCKEYTFDIRAITSDHISGQPTYVNISTKLPKDNYVELKWTDITTSSDSIDFSWDLVDKSVARCVTSYKVIYWNEIDTPKDDTTNTKNYKINDTISCMTYYVRINANVNQKDITPKIIEGNYRAVPTSAPGSPSLDHTDTLSESATFLFTVDSYTEYRCNFTLCVEISGSGLDEKYSFPIEDDAKRDHVINATAYNLLPNNGYDGLAWTENVAGKSQSLGFKFFTKPT